VVKDLSSRVKGLGSRYDYCAPPQNLNLNQKIYTMNSKHYIVYPKPYHVP